MKECILKLAVILSIISGTTAAYAVTPTTNLAVKGTVAIPGCTVNLANNGTFNLGQVSATVANGSSNSTTLPAVTQTLTATCDAQTYLSFSVIDNRAGTASPATATNFGLGNVNGTGKIGSYTVTLTNPRVDGLQASTYATNGTTFTAVNSVLLAVGSRNGWASGNTQKAGRVFSVDLTALPSLAGITAMKGPVSDAIDLSGSLTLNFAYGL
jgi:type 1 fimbria pilin